MMFIALSLAFLLLTVADANAAPLVGALVAAIGLTGTVATIVTGVITAGVYAGLAYLLRPKIPEQEGGVELDIKVDPLVPQSFIVGRGVTAGSRVYLESYGDKNKYVIDIISVSDAPVSGLVAAYVDGQLASFTPTGNDLGNYVDTFDERLGFRFYDGTQLSADQFTVDALGDHPERPWTSNHVGHNKAYARIWYKYNMEKLAQILPWKFVVDGVKLYDPRKDSSVGGSGSHRWDDLSTHEFTSNLAVICYNILRGVRVLNSDGDVVHFYGLENTPAEHLPLDNWFAAMNEADVLVPKLGGTGTEPQFHGGMEIQLDMEPLSVCREILKATGGRLSEMGGIYKLHLGAPGLPIVSFDDGALLADEPEIFEPVRPLVDRTTYISGTYLSPDDDWVEKAAPPRTNVSEETRIGRRVEAELSAPMVQSPSHIQRVMKQVLARVARERRHSVHLPPALFGVEPGDIVEWTSERNGYVNKLFEIESCDIDVNLRTSVSLLEVDPDDYDWTSDDQIPTVPGTTLTPRPPPKLIDDFDAEGYLQIGDDGSRRPAIRVMCVPPDDDDINGVAFQIRRLDAPLDIATPPPITDRDGVEAGEAILLASLTPVTAYQVRGRFSSFEGYATDWSLWIDVVTPESKISPGELSDELENAIRYLLERYPIDLWEIRKQLSETNDGLYNYISAMVEREGQIYLGVGQRHEQSMAAAELALTAAADAENAIAALFVGLWAKNQDGEAEGLIRFISATTPDDAISSFAIEARASYSDNFTSAGLYIDVGAFPNGALSRIRLVGDEVWVENNDGLKLPALLFRRDDAPKETPIVSGILSADLIGRDQAFRTTVNDDVEIQFRINAWPGAAFTMILEIDGSGHDVTFDPVTHIGSPPLVNNADGVITTLECKVNKLSPPEWSCRIFSEGTTTVGSTRVFGISPPIGGYSIWYLDLQGPLESWAFDAEPGDYTITPLGTSLECEIELWGPGGSSGGVGADTATQTGNGTPTKFVWSGGTMQANAGGRSLNAIYGKQGGGQSDGGSGGTASGGTSNNTGANGGDGTVGTNTAKGGNGAAGGGTGGGAAATTQASTSSGNSPGPIVHGVPGNTPGGGAGGASTYRLEGGTFSPPGASGGGAGGGRNSRAFGTGVLLQNVGYVLTIGDSGDRGTVQSESFRVAQGAKGGRGGFRIS